MWKTGENFMSDFYNFFQSTKMDIVTAGYADIGKEWKYMVNDFLYVRIYYIRSGSAQLMLIDGPIDLEEGYLYFIPAFSILSGSCSGQMGHYFIHIIPDIFTEHFFKALSLKHRCKMDAAEADFLFPLIVHNYNKNTLSSRIATDSALKLIFSHFFTDLSADTSNSNLNRFTAVFEYIDKHIDEKIYIHELSALTYTDDAYFSNLFKKTFGISLQKYILNKKTDRAKSLLSTDMTVAEIAEQLNFFDAASFTNFFKKQTNMTPKDFRSRLHKSPSSAPQAGRRTDTKKEP